MSRAEAIKHGYTTGARGLASRSVDGLTRTRITPNVLTATGVTLCGAAAVLVLFEGRDEFLFYWLAAVVFVLGSLLDILDGALARAGGKTTPFGAFIDSTTDRVSEGFMLTAIAWVLARTTIPRSSPWPSPRSRGHSSSRTHARARRRSACAATSDRLPGRTRRRHHRRSRSRAVGRTALVARPPRVHRVDHGRPARPARAQATSSQWRHQQ